MGEFGRQKLYENCMKTHALCVCTVFVFVLMPFDNQLVCLHPDQQKGMVEEVLDLKKEHWSAILCSATSFKTVLQYGCSPVTRVYWVHFS